MTYIAPPSPARCAASPTHPGDTASHHVGVLIIGAGFSGLGAAITLQKDGYTDFLVLERGNNVGGTWRVNTYPGRGLRCAFAPVLLLVRAEPQVEPFVFQTARNRGLHSAGCPTAPRA